MIRRSENGSAVLRISMFAPLLCAACSSTPSAEPDKPQDSVAQIATTSIAPPAHEAHGQDTAKQQTSFFVKDPTQYSATFLAAFREKNGWIGRHIELRGDSMIVEGDPLQEAIILPTDLPLKKKVRYTRNRHGRNYRLELTRINISTVAYHYTVNDGLTALLDLEGTADLDPIFYYGADGEFEDGGKTFGMNKYYTNDTTRADFLLIGHGSIAKASFIRSNGPPPRHCALHGHAETMRDLNPNPTLQLVTTRHQLNFDRGWRSSR
jgi:hypothetical protein